MKKPQPLTGRCSCGAIRYQLRAAPLIVHACHCRDCQRLTGAAFVINIWIERRFVSADFDRLRSFQLTGGSGKPHEVFFCPACATYLWSKYHVVAADSLFVRAGTLDDPGAIRPDVHIFTRSKLAWLTLPQDTPSFASIYRLDDFWPKDKLARFRAA